MQKQYPQRGEGIVPEKSVCNVERRSLYLRVLCDGSCHCCTGKKGQIDYIQKLFDEMVAIYDMPTVFGKELRMTDLMKQFEKDYDIDFRRIKVHMESESEFVKGVM